jgi:hypothetical protein
MSLLNGTRKNDQTKFPAGQLVSKLFQQTRASHIRSLNRLANLSVPVIGGTATPTDLKNTVEEVLAHGATTSLFGELFSGTVEGRVKREEFDQKLINWIFQVPELRRKISDLEPEVQNYIEEFRKTDLSVQSMNVEGFQRPLSGNCGRKVGRIKVAWEEQFKIDGGRKYSGILEGNGDPVIYIEKIVFENWGETVENIPAVSPF